MKLKKGKVYCLKNYDCDADHYYNDNCHFIKGNVYNMIEEKFEDFTLYIADYNDKKIRFHHQSPFAKIIIPEYFVTEQEYRKLKIQKLQDESRR